LDVASAKDGAGWLAFLRGLVACGLSGVQLVTSDAHAGLVAAIGSALPGASLATLSRALPAGRARLPNRPRRPSRVPIRGAA
jgi:transposase-like protein